MARSGMPRLSRETLAIVGAGIARADRAARRAEARAGRETFRSHILPLIEQQGVPSVRLDGLRDPPASNR